MRAQRKLDARATVPSVWIVLVSTWLNLIQRLKLVGARGFEPPTSSSRTTRATKLRYAPTDPALREGKDSGTGAAPCDPRSQSSIHRG